MGRPEPAASRIETRLAKMGLALPAPFKYPSANRTGCVQVGRLLYTSGHPPPAEPDAVMRGKVDAEIPEADAVDTARKVALNILASVKQQIGSLDKIVQVVKVTGMVNSSPGYERQFAVIDGASDLFLALFGPEAGQHARSAVGMAELPRGFPMEIEAIFEVEA